MNVPYFGMQSILGKSVESKPNNVNLTENKFKCHSVTLDRLPTGRILMIQYQPTHEENRNTLN